VTTLTRVKVALALIGLLLFGAGVRLERIELRWAGLGFVVVAWLLRFIRQRKAAESEAGEE
jgi:glucose dehydrogenase